MSLIDQIRSQADEVREQQEREQEVAAKREQVYRQIIIPKLNGVVSYFTELFNHLNVVKPDTRATYKLNGIGEFADMLQGNYLATTDSNINTRIVKITYDCVGEKQMVVTLGGKRQIEEQARYLLENHLRFKHKVIPGSFRRDEQVEYTVEPSIGVSILFEADIENSVIHMASINHEGIGSWRRTIQPDEIDEPFCDDLGRYIIRESESFRSAKLSNDLREQLAAKVEAEKNARQTELDKAVTRMLEEDAEEAKAPSGLFKLFKR